MLSYCYKFEPLLEYISIRIWDISLVGFSYTRCNFEPRFLGETWGHGHSKKCFQISRLMQMHHVKKLQWKLLQLFYKLLLSLDDVNPHTQHYYKEGN